MASKVETTETGVVRATFDGKKQKNPKDYLLQGIEFQAASNGVIATCRFRLKPEVEKKLTKEAKSGYIDYDVRNHEEKYVFEGFEPIEVSDFLVKSMREFQGSKAKATESEGDGE